MTPESSCKSLSLSNLHFDDNDDKWYPWNCFDNSNGCEELDYSSLRFLRSLTASSAECLSLNVIGSMRHLSTLCLRECGIDDARIQLLSFPSNLLSLDVSRNRLTQVPDLSHLVDLEELNVSRNQIGTLSESTRFPPSLLVLDASHNHLDSCLDFSGFPILETINLSDNKLTAFPVLPDLVLDVDLSGNSLCCLKLSSHTQYLRLEYLSFLGNPFQIVPEIVVSKFPHLRELSVPVSDSDRQRYFAIPSLQLLNGASVSKRDKVKYIHGF